MSDFINFALDRGLIIGTVTYGRWVRVPTIDHPHSKNGAYFHNHEYAHVQNWATMDDVETWQDGKDRPPVNQKELQKRLRKSQQEYAQARHKANQAAIKKAEIMLSRCKQDISEYFARKGYPEMCFNVLFEDDKPPLVCVPMRIDGKLSGLQTIEPDGTKKFLYGSNASMATFDIGRGKTVFLVEGLLTGLSLQDVLKRIKIDYKIRICFSAGNMKKIADSMKECFLVVDNDESGTGQRVGQESGKPYYVPEITGDDLNDEVRRVGVFKVMQKFQKILYFDKKIV